MEYGGDPKDLKRDGTGCLHIVVDQGESDECLEMLNFLLDECECLMTAADKYGCSPYLSDMELSFTA